MAASFKLPSPTRKRRRGFEFPEFAWRYVKISEELGSGTFGTVYLADLGEMQRHVCVKKLKGESADSKRRFEKEVGILHSVKGHRNISGFLRFCYEPYAIMMEYSCFDFGHFCVEKKVTTLQDFVHFVDAEFDFSSFADVLLVCTTWSLDFTNPCFTNPCFTNPRFTNPCFTNPCFTNPVRVLQIQSSLCFTICPYFFVYPYSTRHFFARSLADI